MIPNLQLIFSKLITLSELNCIAATIGLHKAFKKLSMRREDCARIQTCMSPQFDQWKYLLYKK